MCFIERLTHCVGSRTCAGVTDQSAPVSIAQQLAKLGNHGSEDAQNPLEQLNFNAGHPSAQEVSMHTTFDARYLCIHPRDGAKS